MNEFDKMKAHNSVMRDPEFSLRILWIRQVLLYIFLGVGIVMTCVLTSKAISGDTHLGNILFPACWTVIVIMLTRDGMYKIKMLKRKTRAQQCN